MSDQRMGCKCGSGGHPRKCAVHPFAYAAHVAEMNFEDALFSGPYHDATIEEYVAELQQRYEILEKANKANLYHRCEEEDKLRARIKELEASMQSILTLGNDDETRNILPETAIDAAQSIARHIMSNKENQ